MPLAGDAYLNGGLPLSHNPLDRISHQPFQSELGLEALFDLWKQFFEEIGIPAIEAVIGAPLAIITTVLESIQKVVDAIINALTGGSGIGQPIALLQSVIGGVAGLAQAANDAAASASYFVGSALGSVVQLVQGLLTPPTYNQPQDVLTDFQSSMGNVHNTGQHAYVTADSALALATLTSAQVNSTGVTITDTFDRSVASTLGAAWDQSYSIATAGTGYLGTDGNNDAHWTAQGGTSKDVIARHTTVLSTDTMAATIVVAANILQYSTGDNPEEHIWLRMNAARTAGIKAIISYQSCEIGYVNSGTYTRIGSKVTGITSTSGIWEFRAGTIGNSREFVLLQGTNEMCRRTDAGSASQLGASYRYTGFGMHAGIDISFFAYFQGSPPNVQAYTAFDRAATA